MLKTSTHNVRADETWVNTIDNDVSIVFGAGEALLQLLCPHHEEKLGIAIGSHTADAPPLPLFVIERGEVETTSVVEA